MPCEFVGAAVSQQSAFTGCSPSCPSFTSISSTPQGRVVPCEFIGTIKSQQSVYLKGELVSNHDELMCNFFAQVWFYG